MTTREYFQDGQLRRIEGGDLSVQQMHQQALTKGAAGSSAYLVELDRIARAEAEAKARLQILNDVGLNEGSQLKTTVTTMDDQGNEQSVPVSQTLASGTLAKLVGGDPNVDSSNAAFKDFVDMSVANTKNQIANETNMDMDMANMAGTTLTNTNTTSDSADTSQDPNNNANTLAGNLFTIANTNPLNFNPLPPTTAEQAQSIYDVLLGAQAATPAQIFQRFQAGRFQDPRFRQAQYAQLPYLQTAYTLARDPQFDVSAPALSAALSGQYLDPITKEAIAGGQYAGMSPQQRQDVIARGGLSGEFRNPFERFISGAYGGTQNPLDINYLTSLTTGAADVLNQTPAQIAALAEQGGALNFQEAARQEALRSSLLENPYLQAQAAALPIVQQTAQPFQQATSNIINNLYGRYMQQNPLGNFLQYAQAQNLGGIYA